MRPRRGILVVVVPVAALVGGAAPQASDPVPPAAGQAAPGEKPGLGALWPVLRSAVEASAREDDRSATDAAFLEAVLTGPGSTPSMRRGAAERLLRDASPEATRAIDRALRSSDVSVSAAALAALDRSALRVPQLAEALAALASSPADIDHAALARVLAAADENAATRLATVALASTAAPVARQGAIATLGEMRSRAAAEVLITLLGEGRAESPDLLRSVFASLERCTGLPHGTDAAAWRRWWNDSAKLVTTPSSDAEVRALASRIEAAERSLADERRRADRLSERLVDVYGQLFLSLTQKERLVRAADLLDDELAAVRTFAVGQIERLLRNGESADDATRRAAVVLLDDPVPALRVRGVRLLDDLGAEDLPTRIVERLPRERDPEVAAAELAALANRPNAAAFNAVLPLVRDAALGEGAFRVLNRLVEKGMVPSEWKTQVLPAVREVVAARPSGAAVQLLAVAGDDADLQRVTALLDSGDASVRRGAAEGLRRRGVRRPLLERSGDSAIYGPLLVAMSEDAKTIETIRSFASVPPPPDMVAEWNAAVARVLRDVPPSDLVDADVLLAEVAACEPATRRVGLGRLVSASRAALPAELAQRGLDRYVDLMSRSGQGAQAGDELARLQAKADEPAFAALFRLRVLSGDFQAAAEMRSEPGPWLQVLSSVIGDPPLARPIADEISLRFGGRLVGEDKATFERLRRSLPAIPASATVPIDR